MAPQQRQTLDEDLSLTEEERERAFVEEQEDRENGKVGNNAQNSFYFLQPPSAQHALLTYQYHGEDRSPLYKYVLSPLAAFLVDHLTPTWLAPNTITLAGLMFMITSYAFMWYYVPTFQEQHGDNNDNDESMDVVPRWVFLYNSMAILIYQTLDNMDGKQARKTGSSSPLGLLWDHGCDAVNSLFGSANWMIFMGMNPYSDTQDLILCTLMLFLPYMLFYIDTWEEYYTGALILPAFNGPSEGLLGAAAMSFASYLYGPAYWHCHSWWNATFGLFLSGTSPPSFILRNADMLMIFSTLGVVQEVISKIWNVFKTYGLHTAKTILPLATLITCFVTVGVQSFSESSTRILWLRTPRLSLHLCAFLFVEMTTDLMLKHMTSQPYPFVRWPSMPLVAFTVLISMFPELLHSEYTSDFMLVYTAAVATYVMMKTTILIHETCTLLNIWCFDITTPRTRCNVDKISLLQCRETNAKDGRVKIE